MACITSTSFSLNLNGDIHGFFKWKRGMRQGDPLSPYLFTLIMEVLTLMIKRRVDLSGLFRYHKHCEELQLINVCFADDLFIFARGDLDSARVIMESFEEFKLTSGLVPSIPKSTTFFCNVPNHVKISILNIMSFAEGGSIREGKAKVAWDDICLPKSEGGLGLRSLDLFNMALMTTAHLEYCF
ncbi:putative RNA-directed DNA polymerase, eukaryota, reverse transcriptase zinc-binding domain protein [Tanacetum coccineum]